MASGKGLKFKTEKSVKASKTRRFLISFAITVLVFALISVLFFLKTIDFDLGNLFDRGEEETTVQSTDTNKVNTYKGTYYFLVCCTDSDEENIRFISLIGAYCEQTSFRVLSISTSTEITVDGTKLSINEHFRQGGIKRLVSAVKVYSGLDIKNYAVSKDSGFRTSVNSVGTLSVKIPENVNYKTDEVNLTLIAGTQGIKGDSLLKYLRWCGTKGEKGLKYQSEIMCCMLDQFIVSKNYNKSENLFSKIINAIESDISIVDFKNSLPYLEYLCTLEERPVSRAVDSVNDLK